MPLVTIHGSLRPLLAGLLIAGCAAGPAYAEADPSSESKPMASHSRLRFAENNGEDIAIRDCLNTAVQAANAENLDTFCDCFTMSSRTKVRKQAAMRFVQHDVSMELQDAHVIKAGRTAGEVAVKYRVKLSDDRFDVVSLVAVKQEEGYWRIRSEKIQSYEHHSPSMCSPSRYACLGATCRLERVSR